MLGTYNYFLPEFKLYVTTQHNDSLPCMHGLHAVCTQAIEANIDPYFQGGLSCALRVEP